MSEKLTALTSLLKGTPCGLKIKDVAKATPWDENCLFSFFSENDTFFVNGKNVVRLVGVTETDLTDSTTVGKEPNSGERSQGKKRKLDGPADSSGKKNKKNNASNKTTKKDQKIHLPWTPVEDSNLIKLVTKFGTSNWKLIAQKLLGSRHFNDVRKRWESSLDPSRSSGSWTPEEDASLVALQAEHSSSEDKWSIIAKNLNGGNRTKKQCQIRWQNVLDPSVAQGDTPWTEKEDEQLIRLVGEAKGKITVGGWDNISKAKTEGGKRTGKQCKRRWTKYLSPSPKLPLTKKNRREVDADNKH